MKFRIRFKAVYEWEVHSVPAPPIQETVVRADSAEEAKKEICGWETPGLTITIVDCWIEDAWREELPNEH